MEKYKHLNELLENKELSDGERQKLSEIISDPEMQEYYSTYVNLRKALFKENHISTDDLAGYVLYKYGRDDSDDRIIAAMPQIEEHLRNCSECRDELKALDEEFISIDSFIKKKLVSREPEDSKKSFFNNFKAGYSYIRIASIAVIVIGGIYLSMAFASEILTPGNLSLAAMSERVDNYLTRGRVSNEFQKGLIALENNNYSATIQFLKDDIKNNKNDKTIFYTHYILGLVYLQEASRDFMGFFPGYNNDEVTEGIHHLKQSVNKNKSGQFNNIQLDAYFFIGKGYLMLNRITDAKEYFNLVISNKGSRSSDAKKILASLQE